MTKRCKLRCVWHGFVIAGFIAAVWLSEGVFVTANAASADTSGSVLGPADAVRNDRFSLNGRKVQGGWILGAAPNGTASLTLDGRPVPLADDGTFLVGFDRDAAASSVLAAVLNNGSVITENIAVSPNQWRIEHINIARRIGAPSAAFMAKRMPELERITAARAMESDAQGWRQTFIWPATGRISGRFGSQRIYRGEPGSYHSGVDIATGGSGAVFVAPADGVVTLVAEEPFTLEGLLLMVDHGNGLNSAFLHCSEILVKPGERVRQGQPIGRIGMTGRATGPHLHWSMKWRDARVDPILFTGPMP